MISGPCLKKLVKTGLGERLNLMSIPTTYPIPHFLYKRKMHIKIKVEKDFYGTLMQTNSSYRIILVKSVTSDASKIPTDFGSPSFFFPAPALPFPILDKPAAAQHLMRAAA